MAATAPARRPVPPDPRNLAGQTTSLCLPDAERSFRTAVLERDGAPPDVVTVSSDGYGNSFADEDWPRAVVDDLLRQFDANGLEAIAHATPQWAADSASVGGDDTSVGFAFRAGSARLPHVPPPVLPVAAVATAAAEPPPPTSAMPPPSGPPVVRRGQAILGAAVVGLVGIGIGWVVHGASDGSPAPAAAATTSATTTVSATTTAAPTTTTAPARTTATHAPTTTARPTTTSSSTTTTSTIEPATTGDDTSSTRPTVPEGYPPVQIAVGQVPYRLDLAADPPEPAVDTGAPAAEPVHRVDAGAWGPWEIIDDRLVAGFDHHGVDTGAFGTPSSLTFAGLRRIVVVLIDGPNAVVKVYDALNGELLATSAQFHIDDDAATETTDGPAAQPAGATATTAPEPHHDVDIRRQRSRRNPVSQNIRVRWRGGDRTFAPGTTVEFGRDPAATVRLDDERVSRRHAELRFDGQSWRLQDLREHERDVRR